MSISVIIPTYNRSELIGKSIESVLSQTYEPMEIIVVDDFSTDNTKEFVLSLKNKKIKYVLNKFSKGANGARNTGIMMAEGDYIAFQDSDDIWLPTKLEKQINLMAKDKEIDMNFCSLNVINQKNRTIPRRAVKKEEIKEKLEKGNFISTQTIFMKTQVAKEILFDENLKRFQDWDFCIRVSEKYIIKHLDEVLVNVELQKDSITKKVDGLEAIYQLFTKHPQLANKDFFNKSLYNKALYHQNYSQQSRKGASKYLFKYLTYKVLEKLSLQEARL